jgi:hypothetical protein
MAEGLWEIASDKKRNAHFFQRVDEGKRILWIGAGVGPQYGDLKRERFWKLLERVSLLMNDFEQRNFFGPQNRRSFGSKFPNRAAPAQSGQQNSDCQRLFQSDILNILNDCPREPACSMRHGKGKPESERLGPTVRIRHFPIGIETAPAGCPNIAIHC